MQSLTHESILGRDFLQENGAVIYVKNGCLTLNGRPLKMKKEYASKGDRVMGNFFKEWQTFTICSRKGVQFQWRQEESTKESSKQSKERTPKKQVSVFFHTVILDVDPCCVLPVHDLDGPQFRWGATKETTELKEVLHGWGTDLS